MHRGSVPGIAAGVNEVVEGDAERSVQGFEPQCISVNEFADLDPACSAARTFFSELSSVPLDQAQRVAPQAAKTCDRIALYELERMAQMRRRVDVGQSGAEKAGRVCIDGHGNTPRLRFAKTRSESAQSGQWIDGRTAETGHPGRPVEALVAASSARERHGRPRRALAHQRRLDSRSVNSHACDYAHFWRFRQFVSVANAP